MKREIVQNLQILIVSAVKISKQCLQTASASAGLRLQTLYGALLLDFTGGAPSPRLPGYSSLIKISGVSWLTRYSGGCGHGLRAKTPNVA